MEPIFEAVLADDPSRITPAGATQRMEEDLFVAGLCHQLSTGAPRPRRARPRCTSPSPPPARPEPSEPATFSWRSSACSSPLAPRWPMRTATASP
ncbi:MAG: hypothetical protein M3Z75_07530 [Actinomycetota bacterium]|nr:hypothetical protein [Actinomycetota bacterium]